MEFLTDWAWIFWIVLILVFAIIEISTLEFTFLMLAIGSLGGLVSGLFGLPWWAQFIVAFILSLLLLFAVRPPLLRALGRGGDPARSNVDALLGMTGTITNDFHGNTGHVKLAQRRHLDRQARRPVPRARRGRAGRRHRNRRGDRRGRASRKDRK